MPFDISFPKFNPGVTLTSAPYRPRQQVIGDPRNDAALAKIALTPDEIAKLLAPPPVPKQPIQNMLANPIRRWAEGYGNEAGGFGGGNRGGYSTSASRAVGGWGTAPGPGHDVGGFGFSPDTTRSSATKGSAGGWGGGLY